MQVKIPTVGPIVGATSARSVRIFIRGELEMEGGGPRRAHGVAQVWKQGQNPDAPGAVPVRYFKLSPNFDVTGVVIYDDLQPNTPYSYRTGWIFSDVDSKELQVDKVLVWSDIATGAFRSGSDDDDAERSFVVGSCRYLLRLFGGSWFDDRGDKTFGSIVRQITEVGRRTDAVLMIGDQIYADDLNLLKPDSMVDEFFKRYREAFTTRCIADLMSRVPTYMTLDDHEIEDNWPAKANAQDYVRKFPAAIHAYLIYQLSHSPLLPSREGKLDGTPDRLWYTFSDGCADFFMMDTRTERVLRTDRRQMLGAVQEQALLAWLSDGSGRVKLIASGVPFFSATSDDKWGGFPEQRERILDFIQAQPDIKVVFLSGDVHASFTAELWGPQPGSKVISVVSSSFFWPYPHPPRSAFDTGGEILTPLGKYTIKNATPIYTEDNFTRVTCTPTQLHVEVFSRKGTPLGESKHAF